MGEHLWTLSGIAGLTLVLMCDTASCPVLLGRWRAELREMPLDTGSGTWQGDAAGPGKVHRLFHPPALLALHRELAAPLWCGPEVR